MFNLFPFIFYFFPLIFDFFPFGIWWQLFHREADQVFDIELGKLAEFKQARKLQDAQAVKLTSLKLTSLKVDELTNCQVSSLQW